MVRFFLKIHLFFFLWGISPGIIPGFLLGPRISLWRFYPIFSRNSIISFSKNRPGVYCRIHPGISFRICAWIPSKILFVFFPEFPGFLLGYHPIFGIIPEILSGFPAKIAQGFLSGFLKRFFQRFLS